MQQHLLLVTRFSTTTDSTNKNYSLLRRLINFRVFFFILTQLQQPGGPKSLKCGSLGSNELLQVVQRSVDRMNELGTLKESIVKLPITGATKLIAIWKCIKMKANCLKKLRGKLNGEAWKTTLKQALGELNFWFQNRHSRKLKSKHITQDDFDKNEHQRVKFCLNWTKLRSF